ncbi:MAG: pesticin C-terminus-like muramidase, partial [Acidithiobacillus sp.]
MSASAAPTNEVGCPPATGNTASAPSSSGSALPPVYACTANNGFNPGVYNTNPNAPQPLSAFGLLGSMAQAQCAPVTAPTASAQSACTIADQAAKDRVIISFIRQHESVGGVINRKASVPHYRNGKVIGHSGVTIGAGIDLGGMTVSQLTGYGMPSTFVKLLKPYLGLQGQAALLYLDAHPLTIPKNLVSNLDQLQSDVEMKTINKVASLYTADASPHVNFFQLPAGAQTAIVDLAFQYGSNLAKAAPIFWDQVTHGQWSAAVTNLNNFGDSYPSRRESEGALIQADISSGKLPTNQS